MKLAAMRPEPRFLKADGVDELIEQARGGSVAAFEALYRLHVGRVHGLCVRICGNPADAQDATQETFIKAWRALGTFRGDSAFSTWLHRIAFNESVRLRRPRSTDDRSLEFVEPAANGRASRLTEVDDLERALAGLPNRAREAIVLHRIYGYTHEETAEFMGISVGASKAQVHRATKLLRSRFPDEIGSAGPSFATDREAASDG
jgi:RNA polymerase sigma-70 factor, ECF subfamily